MTGEETSESRKFAIIGVAGYIAPRHLNAMRSLGCDLVAAHDVFDSVGMIDGYFPRAYFTTDPDDFRKLFEKFERVEKEKTRNIEGTGLGLNIASRLLNLMGSELKVKSEYLKGSEFYFDIKQKIVDIEPLGDFREKILGAEEKENYNISYIAPEAIVLIVDDNSMNRDVFA